MLLRLDLLLELGPCFHRHHQLLHARVDPRRVVGERGFGETEGLGELAARRSTRAGGRGLGRAKRVVCTLGADLDRAERIAFNALPAPWRAGQMWELQYVPAFTLLRCYTYLLV